MTCPSIRKRSASFGGAANRPAREPSVFVSECSEQRKAGQTRDQIARKRQYNTLRGAKETNRQLRILTKTKKAAQRPPSTDGASRRVIRAKTGEAAPRDGSSGSGSAPRSCGSADRPS